MGGKSDSEKSWSATYDEIVANDYNLTPMVYKSPDAPTKGISVEKSNAYLEELRDMLSMVNNGINSIRIKEILKNQKKYF